MLDRQNVKLPVPGDLTRARRNGVELATIENDWTLIRFEPDSSNAILEKNGKRIVVARPEFDSLNFPGSDYLWTLLNAPNPDEDLAQAKSAWAHSDLGATLTALIKHARSLDPAFHGIQTVSDFIEKTKEQENECHRALEILRLDVVKAQREYNQYPASTPLENDQKDNLLSHFRSMEDQYATHKFQCEKLIPAWRKTADALQALSNFISKKH